MLIYFTSYCLSSFVYHSFNTTWTSVRNIASKTFLFEFPKCQHTHKTFGLKVYLRFKEILLDIPQTLSINITKDNTNVLLLTWQQYSLSAATWLEMMCLRYIMTVFILRYGTPTIGKYRVVFLGKSIAIKCRTKFDKFSQGKHVAMHAMSHCNNVINSFHSDLHHDMMTNIVSHKHTIESCFSYIPVWLIRRKFVIIQRGASTIIKTKCYTERHRKHS